MNFKLRHRLCREKCHYLLVYLYTLIFTTGCLLLYKLNETAEALKVLLENLQFIYTILFFILITPFAYLIFLTNFSEFILYCIRIIGPCTFTVLSISIYIKQVVVGAVLVAFLILLNLNRKKENYKLPLFIIRRSKSHILRNFVYIYIFYLIIIILFTFYALILAVYYSCFFKDYSSNLIVKYSKHVLISIFTYLNYYLGSNIFTYLSSNIFIFDFLNESDKTSSHKIQDSLKNCKSCTGGLLYCTFEFKNRLNYDGPIKYWEYINSGLIPLYYALNQIEKCYCDRKAWHVSVMSMYRECPCKRSQSCGLYYTNLFNYKAPLFAVMMFRFFVFSVSLFVYMVVFKAYPIYAEDEGYFKVLNFVVVAVLVYVNTLWGFLMDGVWRCLVLCFLSFPVNMKEYDPILYELLDEMTE